MRRIVGILVIFILMVTIFTGCGSNATKSTPNNTASTTTHTNTENGDKQLLIGFSAGYSRVQHWELEILGAQTAAKELGVKFVYQFANGDIQKQINDIENMVQMGIDALIVGPADSMGIVPTVHSLWERGIPVLASDINVSGAKVVAYVASDNYEIGVLAAEHLAKVLNGKGKIAIVGWKAATATNDRERGFVDTIKSKYPDIKIVANQDAGGERSRALARAEDIIQANKDIQAIFGANAECALGAYEATRSMNRTDIKIVAVDTDNEVMQAIANNTNLIATIAQDPFQMGYTALKTLVDYLNGKEVHDVAIPVEVVTKDNVNDIIQRDKNHLKSGGITK
ncbi:substrate-binding domain-containing protein [Thermoanaerobacter brockii subsp. lactiethylicus]